MRKKEFKIRAFRDGAIRHPFALACEAAFYSLPRSAIVLYAEYMRIAIPPASSLFDVLLVVLKSYLEISEAEAVQFIFTRLAAMHRHTTFSKDLLQIDDAIYCLDRNDFEALTDRQRHALKMLEEKSEFVKAYTAKKRSLAGDGGPGGGGGGGAVGGPAYPLVFSSCSFTTRCKEVFAAWGILLAW